MLCRASRGPLGSRVENAVWSAAIEPPLATSSMSSVAAFSILAIELRSVTSGRPVLLPAGGDRSGGPLIVPSLVIPAKVVPFAVRRESPDA